MGRSIDELDEAKRDLCAIAYELSALRFELVARRQYPELKFRPDQARVPAGTTQGGRFTPESTTSYSAQAARARAAALAGLRRVGVVAAANPEAAAAAVVSGAAPVMAAGVGVSRAAGLADHYVTGRPITPFLHLPGDAPDLTPLQISRPVGDSPERQSLDRECELLRAQDIRQCQREADLGRNEKEQNQIFAVCMKTVSERYAECLGGGGAGAIKTPLFSVTKRVANQPSPKRKK